MTEEEKAETRKVQDENLLAALQERQTCWFWMRPALPYS